MQHQLIKETIYRLVVPLVIAEVCLVHRKIAQVDQMPLFLSVQKILLQSCTIN